MKIENYEDKFIKIIHIESKPKTEVYDVISKYSNLSLGEINWDNGWRHYIFNDEIIKLSDRCLFALGKFVKKCNEKHKK